MATQESSPSFSDPDFSARVNALHESATRQQEQELTAQEAEASQQQEERENINRLATIAVEIADAANDNPDLAAQKVPLYELREKGAVRKFMNNRGKQEHAEATQGWIIVPSSSSTVTKSGKATLANNSGLGLVLTEDGKLHGYVAQKGVDALPNPLRHPIDTGKAVAGRYEKVDRRHIGRKTLAPKEDVKIGGFKVGTMPEETFAPRYRPEEGRPTLLAAMDDPSNQLASPLVIKQCYDALAGFVANNLQSPQTEDPADRQPTAPFSPEPPTEILDRQETPEEDAESEDAISGQSALREVESLSDQEKIDQWFDEGLITVQAWLKDNALDQRHNPGKRGNQFLTVYNERSKATGLLEVIKKARTPETIRKVLANKGINELLTVMEIDKKFEEVDANSPMAKENIVLISYEVPNNGKSSRNETIMNLFLPASEANEALHMIYDDPTKMEEITESFMDNYLGVGESWDDTRPDYEKLRKKSSGKRRLAFRPNFTAKPDQGTVKEF